MKLPRETNDKYVVEAVLKALDVLESFRDSEELQLSEISKRVSLNKSRAFRLLHTLCERGYVERGTDGHRYRLGIKLFEHASSLRRDVKQVAQPYMRKLQLRFNETVMLAVPDTVVVMPRSCINERTLAMPSGFRHGLRSST